MACRNELGNVFALHTLIVLLECFVVSIDLIISPSIATSPTVLVWNIWYSVDNTHPSVMFICLCFIYLVEKRHFEIFCSVYCVNCDLIQVRRCPLGSNTCQSKCDQIAKLQHNHTSLILQYCLQWVKYSVLFHKFLSALFFVKKEANGKNS